MEDSKKREAPPDAAAQKKGRIVELTPGLEVRSGTRARIIDLTHVLHAPPPSPQQEAAPPSQPEPREETDAPLAGPAAEDEAVAGADGEATDEPADHEQDAVIELTDIVDPTELEAASDFPDDEVIELTDIVDPAELAASMQEQAEDEDAVIELTDIVDPADLAAASDFPDDEVIELTDIVDPEEIEATLLAVDAQEDRVIRLDRVLDHVRRHEERIEEEITSGIAEEPANESLTPDTKEAGTAIGIEWDNVMASRGPSPDVTEKDLERVIEQVIRTKYAHTIEKTIAAVVEKIVTRDMESIKRSLLSDEEPEE